MTDSVAPVRAPDFAAKTPVMLRAAQPENLDFNSLSHSLTGIQNPPAAWWSDNADISARTLMTLLDDALRAYGPAGWQRFTRFVVHMTLRGILLTRGSHKQPSYEIVAEGSFQTRRIQLTGFDAPDRRCICEADRVAIQDSSDTVLRSRDHPIETLRQRASPAQWDDLDLAYYLGTSIWEHLATPFLLARPGLVTEEPPPWLERGSAWRRLKISCPPDRGGPPSEKVYYFDKGLPRRVDVVSVEAGNPPLTHYASAHVNFSGLMVPTLRTSFHATPDGKYADKDALIDLEIFDAAFS